MDPQHPLLADQIEDDAEIPDPQSVKAVVSTTDRFQ